MAKRNYTLYLDDNLMAAVKERAGMEDRSVSNVMSAAAREWLRDKVGTDPLDEVPMEEVRGMVDRLYKEVGDDYGTPEHDEYLKILNEFNRRTFARYKDHESPKTRREKGLPV